MLPSLEWLPAVPVRTFDEERACSRRWLRRWLVVCDHRANVIGRSKVTVDIAVRSAHGPVSNQLCRIHPGCAPRSEARRLLLPLFPSVSHCTVSPSRGSAYPSNEPFQPIAARLVGLGQSAASSSSLCIAHCGSSPRKGHARGRRRQADCAGRGPGAVALQTLRGEEAISPQLSPPHCVRPHRIPGCG